MRQPKLLLWGLIALMAGLFASAFILNKRHYDALNTSLEGTLALFLENQANAQLFTLAKQEQEMFALHGTPRELEADLFIVLPDRIVPASIRDLIETVPAVQAREAFNRGIAVLPSPAAYPFFKASAKGESDTPDDLYRKISSYLNLLEIEHRVQTVCCLLTLLEDPDNLLNSSQNNFFMSMLAEQEPNLPAIRQRLDELSRTADALDAEIPRQNGTYHTRFKDRTFSVSEGGLALLYHPKLAITAPVEITYSRPPGIHREIVPGIYAYLPPHLKNEGQEKIRKQYLVGTIILGGMVMLGAGLAGGMMVSARHQRELSAMRTQFIATVSHELRTPLSLIRLHAETLHHGRIPEDRIADYYHTILTESERLTGIVNNVLDFSRMERGKMNINLEPVNLSDCTERIVDSFRYRFDNEGFEVERNIAPSAVAMADPLAWSQILFNLLDNAVKYSDHTKTIRIELETSGNEVVLRVSDHGIGIPDKLKSTIFDDFVRSGDSRVTARRGSGIGLSVTRKLLEKMDGTIGVADNPPHGSVFTVKLDSCDETAGG